MLSSLFNVKCQYVTRMQYKVEVRMADSLIVTTLSMHALSVHSHSWWPATHCNAAVLCAVPSHCLLKQNDQLLGSLGDVVGTLDDLLGA